MVVAAHGFEPELPGFSAIRKNFAKRLVIGVKSCYDLTVMEHTNAIYLSTLESLSKAPDAQLFLAGENQGRVEVLAGDDWIEVHSAVGMVFGSDSLKEARARMGEEWDVAHLTASIPECDGEEYNRRFYAALGLPDASDATFGQAVADLASITTPTVQA